MKLVYCLFIWIVSYCGVSALPFFQHEVITHNIKTSGSPGYHSILFKYIKFDRTLLKYVNNSTFEACFFKGYDRTSFFHSASRSNFFVGSIFEDVQFKSMKFEEFHHYQTQFYNSLFDQVVVNKSTFLVTDFSQSDIRRSVFNRCEFVKTDFSQSKLDEVIILNSSIDNDTFETLPDTVIIGFDGLEAYVAERKTLHKHVFDLISFDGLNLAYAQFYGTIFSDSSFKNIDLKEAEFDLVTWRDVALDTIVAKNVVISGNVIENALFKDVNFRKSVFGQTIIRNTTFKECNFDRVKWNNVLIQDCTFVECSFKHRVIDNVNVIDSKGFY